MLNRFKIKISHTVVISFLIMSFLLVILGVVAVLYTNRMQDNTRRILEENVSSLKAAEELELALLDMKGLTSYYLRDGQQKWLDIFNEKKATFLYWRQEVEKKNRGENGRDLLQAIDSLYLGYLNAQQQTVDYCRQGRLERAHALLTTEMFYLFDRIYERCESLLLIHEKAMYNASALVERDSITVNYVVYGMAFSSVLLAVGLGLLLSNRITHPIYNLVLRIQSATGEQRNIVEQVNATDLTEMEHLDALVQNLLTKVRQANEELQKNAQVLARSEKYAALGCLAAGVAHEIRNPLTAIKMLLYTLQDELGDSSPLSPDVEVMIREIGRIEKFVQDFLDFARPPKPTLKDHTMAEILEPTVALLTPQLKKQNIDIEMSSELPNATVRVDEEQMRQVFLNILINAIQAMPEGGRIRIHVAGRQNGLEHPHLCVAITDSGPGIQLAQLPTLFEPFSTTKEDGTGLGLSIADQIIHNHAGWIEAANAEPNGAVFSIYLPLKQRDKA